MSHHKSCKDYDNIWLQLVFTVTLEPKNTF